jgi:putative oxidoreductase
LLTAGLLSGFAAWIPVMLFIVIIFFVHKTDPVKEKEDTILFLLAFLTILLCGPGKWSLDKLIGK